MECARRWFGADVWGLFQYVEQKTAKMPQKPRPTNTLMSMRYGNDHPSLYIILIQSEICDEL